MLHLRDGIIENNEDHPAAFEETTMKHTFAILAALTLALAPAAHVQKKASQAATATAPPAVEHKGDVTDITVIRSLRLYWRPEDDNFLSTMELECPAGVLQVALRPTTL